jgi:hypothetical protein
MNPRVTHVGSVLTLVGVLFSVLACGGASPPLPVPAGAATGLNTFIYVYSDT